MPAACSSAGRLCTRNASITMSCVAEANATRRAANPTHERREQGVARAEKRDRTYQQELGANQPATAAPQMTREIRNVPCIDDGRPQEFQGVGQSCKREQPDGAEVDTAVGHPHAQRLTRQCQRQSGGESQEQYDHDAGAQIDSESGSTAARRLSSVGDGAFMMGLFPLGREVCLALARLSPSVDGDRYAGGGRGSQAWRISRQATEID